MARTFGVGGQTVRVLGIIDRRMLGCGNGVELGGDVGEMLLVVGCQLFAAVGLVKPIAQLTIHGRRIGEVAGDDHDRNAGLRLDIVGNAGVRTDGLAGSHVDDHIGIKGNDVFDVGGHVLAHPASDHGQLGEVLRQVSQSLLGWLVHPADQLVRSKGCDRRLPCRHRAVHALDFGRNGDFASRHVRDGALGRVRGRCALLPARRLIGIACSGVRTSRQHAERQHERENRRCQSFSLHRPFPSFRSSPEAPSDRPPFRPISLNERGHPFRPDRSGNGRRARSFSEDRCRRGFLR